MDFARINHIVFSSDVEDAGIVNEAKKIGLNCYSFLDARSAIYGATGIAAQNKQTVVVCVSGNNASRSAYSGMTEAFYRNLPIILITLGGELNYSEELGDVINGHYRAQSERDLETLLNDGVSLPAHIEFVATEIDTEKKKCPGIQNVLFDVLTTEDYLYFSSNIIASDVNFNCKVVQGGMANCYDGALANVLGASLAKKHKRYVGVVTEEEFLHDMNTLGNININDSLLYIIICDSNNSLITNYAESLGFHLAAMNTKDINPERVKAIAKNNIKSIMIIYGDNK